MYSLTAEMQIQQRINVHGGQNATENTSNQHHGFRVCPLTGNLCHHGLRDPPVPQERFDLLFHHAAVPPANTSKNTAILMHYWQQNLKNHAGILHIEHFRDASIFFLRIQYTAVKPN